MDIKATLNKELGPLPLWGWAVALGGAVIAFIILPKVLSKMSGQSQDAGTNAAGMGIDPSSGLPTGIYPGGGTTPTADNSNQLNDILSAEQAIINGQQAMEDEFKKFIDQILGIRDGLTPPTSPPAPIPAQLPPGDQPPVPVGPDGQPITGPTGIIAPPAPVGGPGGGPQPPIRPGPPGPQPPVRPGDYREAGPYNRYRPGPGYVPPGGWLPPTGPIPVQSAPITRK